MVTCPQDDMMHTPGGVCPFPPKHSNQPKPPERQVNPGPLSSQSQPNTPKSRARRPPSGTAPRPPSHPSKDSTPSRRFKDTPQGCGLRFDQLLPRFVRPYLPAGDDTQPVPPSFRSGPGPPPSSRWGPASFSHPRHIPLSPVEFVHHLCGFVHYITVSPPPESIASFPCTPKTPTRATKSWFSAVPLWGPGPAILRCLTYHGGLPKRYDVQFHTGAIPGEAPLTMEWRPTYMCSFLD